MPSHPVTSENKQFHFVHAETNATSSDWIVHNKLVSEYDKFRFQLREARSMVKQASKIKEEQDRLDPEAICDKLDDVARLAGNLKRIIQFGEGSAASRHIEMRQMTLWLLDKIEDLKVQPPVLCRTVHDLAEPRTVNVPFAWFVSDALEEMEKDDDEAEAAKEDKGTWQCRIKKCAAVFGNTQSHASDPLHSSLFCWEFMWMGV